MNVIILDSAYRDLAEIADFINIDSPKRALSFVEKLLSRCESLADLSLAFPLIPRYEQYGIRRLPYRDYLIFYRVQGECLEVLHILHGARDFETLLFGSNLTYE